MQKLIKNFNTSTVNGKCGQKCELFLEFFFLNLKFNSVKSKLKFNVNGVRRSKFGQLKNYYISEKLFSAAIVNSSDGATGRAVPKGGCRPSWIGLWTNQGRCFRLAVTRRLIIFLEVIYSCFDSSVCRFWWNGCPPACHSRFPVHRFSKYL